MVQVLQKQSKEQELGGLPTPLTETCCFSCSYSPHSMMALQIVYLFRVLGVWHTLLWDLCLIHLTLLFLALSLKATSIIKEKMLPSLAPRVYTWKRFFSEAWKLTELSLSLVLVPSETCSSHLSNMATAVCILLKQILGLSESQKRCSSARRSQKAQKIFS